MPVSTPLSIAFITERLETREDVRGLNLTYVKTRKLIRERWQSLSATEREIYETEALAARERYHAESQKYKTTAFYREYMQYLADFKAGLTEGQVGMVHDRRELVPFVANLTR